MWNVKHTASDQIYVDFGIKEGGRDEENKWSKGLDVNAVV